MRLRWSPEALDDLDRIGIFNEGRSASWARKVEHRIMAGAQSLMQFPLKGRPVGRGIRMLSLTDVQYVLDYEADEAGVTILRVRSTREVA